MAQECSGIPCVNKASYVDYLVIVTLKGIARDPVVRPEFMRVPFHKFYTFCRRMTCWVQQLGFRRGSCMQHHGACRTVQVQDASIRVS